jgi:two-component system, OmpR family, sensor histidine kinase CpxA
MAGARMPIYAKVLLWFLLNLLLLAALGYGFMRLQFRVSLDWMLAGPTGERIEQIANTLSDVLSRKPESEWPEVLQRYDREKGLRFALFNSEGRQILGQAVEVPREMRFKLIDKRVPVEMAASRPRPQASPLPRPTDNNPVPPKPRFIFRSDNPTRYWAGIPVSFTTKAGSASRSPS